MCAEGHRPICQDTGPVREEVVGPAGPTTATRMDKFTEMMLARTGLIAMIGKAERGPVAVEATGNSIHATAPREWQQRIGKIPVAAS